jgi:hypothetical protein
MKIAWFVLMANIFNSIHPYTQKIGFIIVDHGSRKQEANLNLLLVFNFNGT